MRMREYSPKSKTCSKCVTYVDFHGNLEKNTRNKTFGTVYVFNRGNI